MERSQNQKSPSDAPTGSGLRDVFQRFLALEAEGKSLNHHKAALFARAKVDGYDPKALRTAFRQRVREMQDPEATMKHGELTDSYLLILRSEGSGDAGTSDSSPVSFAPAETAPGALARSLAHTRTCESASHDTDGAVIKLGDTKDVRADTSDMRGERTQHSGLCWGAPNSSHIENPIRNQQAASPKIFVLFPRFVRSDAPVVREGT